MCARDFNARLGGKFCETAGHAGLDWLKQFPTIVPITVRASSEGGVFFRQKACDNPSQETTSRLFHHLSFRLAMHNKRLVLVTPCLGIDISIKVFELCQIY